MRHLICSAWILPANRPEGSYENHGAVQSPFHKVRSRYARHVHISRKFVTGFNNAALQQL